VNRFDRLYFLDREPFKTNQDHLFAVPDSAHMPLGSSQDRWAMAEWTE